MRRLLFIGGLLAVAIPRPAEAIRWTLGVASEVTPLVLDRVFPDQSPARFRLAFRPVLELEPARWLAIGAYAPFVVYRTGEFESEDAAAGGAESVFGLSVAGRLPWIRQAPPEEVLFYARVRGGFATVSGRAGPFLGGSIGAAVTWLDTGRGFFFDINVAHAKVSDVPVVSTITTDVERISFGVTVGLVFRLGGEAWRVSGRTRL